MTNSSGRRRVDDQPRLRVQWRKSSYSNNGGDCVEIAVSDDMSLTANKAEGETLYLVRDSKDPQGPVLTFTPTGWNAFCAALRNCELENLGQMRQ
ncbi:DUF397 domain-containing protein [Sphaerisporangium sp. NPDC049003]|uniref:DUF397 domain-containing protein n=1 Tax=Sphaerisporangium sp. NPDC049003 TaxID=3364517 RepID=UPI00372036E9